VTLSWCFPDEHIGERVIVYFYSTSLREIDLRAGANILITNKITPHPTR
jgi:hypothetical protein